jgi:hypothetical protein
MTLAQNAATPTGAGTGTGLSHPDQWSTRMISIGRCGEHRCIPTEEDIMKLQLIRTSLAAVGALSAAGPAAAQTSSGSSKFGQHVAHCAREMGFNGMHNPGMHQGASGWNGSECEH